MSTQKTPIRNWGIPRVEFMFECLIEPDANQSSISVPLVKIAVYAIYLTGLVQLVRDKISKIKCVYMEDVA